MIINNEHLKGTDEIEETIIYNTSKGDTPQVQVIINIFKNKRATIKGFMPRYPAEQSFYWLIDKIKVESDIIMKAIHAELESRGVTADYIGF